MIKTAGTIIKNVWLMIGMTLAALCLLEGGVSLAILVKERLSGVDAESMDQRVAADTYSDRSWVNRYYQEFRRSRDLQWKSYVYWRQRPHRGDHINIDTDGIRLTTVGEPQEKSNSPVKIFMFGGSTLWGTGARDAFTIPSLVAKELHYKGIVSEITNFGETAYVSTQEVIALLLRLQKGDIPNLVIFYDGVNDTMSAYQQHVAGLPQNEFNRVREFNLSKPDNFRERAAMMVRDVVAQLSMVHLLRDLLRRSEVRSDDETDESRLGGLKHPSGRQFVNFESLARDVFRTYVTNLDLVKALSDDYRFGYLFYWQPTIFDKPDLTEYERLQRDKMRSAEQFIRKTYEIMQHARLPEQYENSFHDLSGLFSEVREPVYLDWSHPGESGNKVIAERMVNDIVRAITASKASQKRNDPLKIIPRRLVVAAKPQ